MQLRLLGVFERRTLPAAHAPTKQKRATFATGRVDAKTRFESDMAPSVATAVIAAPDTCR